MTDSDSTVPDAARGLRGVCLLLILFNGVLIAGVSSVVYFALGNNPVIKANGREALTGVGAVLTLSAVLAATFIGPALLRAGVRKVATTPPDSPEEGAPPDTDADRLLRVYAQGKFTEYALADGAAVVTAVLFHLSADWLMIGFVAGMGVYQIVRFPTAARVRGWLASAQGELERLRGERAE